MSRNDNVGVYGRTRLPSAFAAAGAHPVKQQQQQPQSQLQQLHQQQRQAPFQAPTQQQHQAKFQQVAQIRAYREVQADYDDEEESSARAWGGNNKQNGDAMVSLLPSLPPVTVQEDDEEVTGSYYTEQTNEAVLSLTEGFEKMSLSMNLRPTDFNQYTSLPTQVDDLNLISLPVNSFCVAEYDQATQSLTVQTPKRSNPQHCDDVDQVRKAISFVRHHFLSHPKAEPVTLSTALYQLAHYIELYNNTKPNHIYLTPRHPTVPSEKRQILTDYLFNCAVIKTKMSYETFAFGLYLFDRMASCPLVKFNSTEDMQLNGLIALYLSYKMIEKRIAAASTIHSQTQRFSPDLINSRERHLLTMLSFDTKTTSLSHMVRQILTLFTYCQQRDISDENRHPTDNISSTSGRFVRLVHMLNFITTCVLMDFEYSAYNGFSLACAIFMVALATITSDFTQIWPLSLSVLLGVTPSDVQDAIRFVIKQMEALPRAGSRSGKNPFSHVLDFFCAPPQYGVGKFAPPTWDAMQAKMMENDAQMAVYLKENNVDIKIIPRLCALQSKCFQVLSVLDERNVTKNAVPKKSPLRRASQKMSNSNHLSPIVHREQQSRLNQSGDHEVVEYLVVLIFDPRQENNPFSTVSEQYDRSQALYSALLNVNPLTVKCWMAEEDLLHLPQGEDLLNDFQLDQMAKEQSKNNISNFTSPFSPKVGNTQQQQQLAPVTPVIQHQQQQNASQDNNNSSIKNVPSPTDSFGLFSPTTRTRQGTLVAPSAQYQQAMIQKQDSIDNTQGTIQPNYYATESTYNPQIVQEPAPTTTKRQRHNNNNNGAQDCNPSGCDIM